MNVCLTLPSRIGLSALPTFFGEEIAAVDGLNARIFLFDSCGTCIESVNSLRCDASGRGTIRSPTALSPAVIPAVTACFISIAFLPRSVPLRLEALPAKARRMT